MNAKVLYFSSQRKLEKGIYLEDGSIVLQYRWDTGGGMLYR